jgi:hypothetical protein
VIARPRRLIFGGAAGAASGDAATAARSRTHFWRLIIDEAAREALRLPSWDVWIAFFGVLSFNFSCLSCCLFSLLAIAHDLDFLSSYTVLLRDFFLV